MIFFPRETLVYLALSLALCWLVLQLAVTPVL